MPDGRAPPAALVAAPATSQAGCGPSAMLAGSSRRKFWTSQPARPRPRRPESARPKLAPSIRNPLVFSVRGLFLFFFFSSPELPSAAGPGLGCAPHRAGRPWGRCRPGEYDVFYSLQIGPEKKIEEHPGSSDVERCWPSPAPPRNARLADFFFFSGNESAWRLSTLGCWRRTSCRSRPRFFSRCRKQK